jgi:hypothetical protein
MINRQRAKYDAYQRVADFNQNNSADTATIVEYAAEQLVLTDSIAHILNAGVIQQLTSTPDTETATDSKGELALTINQFTLRGMVKARQLGNTTLSAQLDQPVTYVSKATKSEAIHRATSLRNLLNDNLGTLTNISAADIATMDTAIAAYDNLKNQPIETRQTKKSSGTDVLPAAFAAADVAIANMYALLRSYFLSSKPALVDEFSLAMEIIDTGIRHNVSEFTILADETGNTLAGATLTDAGNNNNYTADENGLVHIDKHQSGHFNFTISASGRQTVSFGADIKKGTLSSFTVRLKLV